MVDASSMAWWSVLFCGGMRMEPKSSPPMQGICRMSDVSLRQVVLGQKAITEIMREVPDEVFDRLPKDGASQGDH